MTQPTNTLDLSQFSPDQQAFILQAMTQAGFQTQPAQPAQPTPTPAQAVPPLQAFAPMGMPQGPAGPTGNQQVVMINGIPHLVSPMAGFGNDPNCGVAGTEQNMISNVLGNVNDGLKTGANFLLELTGGIAGFAIDLVTFGQKKQ